MTARETVERVPPPTVSVNGPHPEERTEWRTCYLCGGWGVALKLHDKDSDWRDGTPGFILAPPSLPSAKTRAEARSPLVWVDESKHQVRCPVCDARGGWETVERTLPELTELTAFVPPTSGSKGHLLRPKHIGPPGESRSYCGQWVAQHYPSTPSGGPEADVRDGEWGRLGVDGWVYHDQWEIPIAPVCLICAMGAEKLNRIRVSR